MNTYGQLSNADLLHMYGFTERDNPYDEVCIATQLYDVIVMSLHVSCAQAIIPVTVLKEVFLSSSTLDGVSSREERWKSIEDNVSTFSSWSVYGMVRFYALLLV